MEGEVYQDEQQGKCQADREKCLLEQQIPRRRNRHKGSRAKKRVEQRECREHSLSAPEREDVGMGKVDGGMSISAEAPAP